MNVDGRLSRRIPRTGGAAWHRDSFRRSQFEGAVRKTSQQTTDDTDGHRFAGHLLLHRQHGPGDGWTCLHHHRRIHDGVELTGRAGVTGAGVNRATRCRCGPGAARASLARGPSCRNRSSCRMYQSSQPRSCAAHSIASVLSFLKLIASMGSITTPRRTLIDQPPIFADDAVFPRRNGLIIALGNHTRWTGVASVLQSRSASSRGLPAAGIAGGGVSAWNRA